MTMTKSLNTVPGQGPSPGVVMDEGQYESGCSRSCEDLEKWEFRSQGEGDSPELRPPHMRDDGGHSHSDWKAVFMTYTPSAGNRSGLALCILRYNKWLDCWIRAPKGAIADLSWHPFYMGSIMTAAAAIFEERDRMPIDAERETRFAKEREDWIQVPMPDDTPSDLGSFAASLDAFEARFVLQK